MAIYPPILASSQEAFLASTSTEAIYFTLSSVTNKLDIGHVQIKVTYQSNNKTAVKTSTYPDGIIYKPATAINDWGGGQYSVSILSSDLEEGWWVANRYYKVQISFGEDGLWAGGLSNFATWKAEQIKQGKFSDWSTVMVLKAIPAPKIKITNKGGTMTGGDIVIESSLDTELTTTPLFQGSFLCEGEAEDKYQFTLYNSDYEVLETTGWTQKKLTGGIDTHRFKTILENSKNYIVGYEVITVNKYHAIAQNYEFTVMENNLTKPAGIYLTVQSELEDGEPYGNENGVLNILLRTDETISGNYVITRSSERSNYGQWEDIKFLNFTNKSFQDDIIHQDFTVESGVKYKYAIQQENMAGLRTAAIYEESTLASSPAREVNFEYSYLLRDGVQLKLRLNQQMSSFKRTVLANKQDTLGSKYPTINRNGDAYYAEFPISGTISLHADDYLTFFEKRNDGYYYKGEKVIDAEKYEVATPRTDVDMYDYNLTHNNFFIERIFRDKVEEFLNDGNCKLYKSPSEGNIVVALMNVSMSPNSQTGRMIFSFSATAYEIMDNTLENLDEYGIIHIGSVEENLASLRADVQDNLIGQVAGLFKAGENLIDVIKQQNEYDIGGGYQYSFMGIDSIQIEGYPKMNFTPQLNELEVQLVRAKTAGDTDLVASIEAKIKELEELQNAVNSQVANPIITVYINQKEVSLGQNRIYQLKNSEQVTSLTLKHTQPVIINYSCSVVSKESEATTVSAVVTSSIWGQTAGVFTTTENILDNYKLMRNAESFEVSSIKDHNFSVYRSLDISEIIKEQVRHQVEQIYNTEFYFDKTLGSSGQWTDGRVRYIFERFKAVEIEADEGTSLIVTNMDDTTQEIIIGRTNKFRLQDLDGIVKNISLKNPAFVIVNYRCLTIQMQMGGK